MESIPDDAPLIVIVGQTASGKSAMAMELAMRFNGEIICADSRTVYKGMDIGTAKPSAEDQRKVSHHLLDITTPDRPITVADFKQRALQALAGIQARGKLPILVGGTGLYVDAVIFDFSFRAAPDPKERKKLLGLSVEELHRKVQALGLPLPENEHNPRHLIRQIESNGEAVQTGELRKRTLIFGLLVEKEELEKRITTRLENMIGQGLEQEVRELADRYGWECRALQTIDYQEFRPYLEEDTSLVSTKEAIIRHSLQYAKRQKTWFKRNKHIHYIRKTEESVDLITTLLNKIDIAA